MRLSRLSEQNRYAARPVGGPGVVCCRPTFYGAAGGASSASSRA